MVYALREALAILAEEGLENVWARHAAAAKELHVRASEQAALCLRPSPCALVKGSVIHQRLFSTARDESRPRLASRRSASSFSSRTRRRGCRR